MTSVTSATSPTAATTTTATTKPASAAVQASIDFGSFLKMMIAELKNQDPTAPTDPTQYLTQISQMTGVQQGIMTNSKLDSLLTMTSLSWAENLIGKTVTSADGTVSGVVKSIAIGTNNVATATLMDGSTLTIDSSIKVSAT